MIVHVAHPVPVMHIPRKARKVRLSFAADRTPVELAQAEPGEMEAVRWEGGTERHARMFQLHNPGLVSLRGGEAWVRMADEMGGLLTPARLASVLSGEARDATASQFWVRHARTPLCAHVVKGGPSHAKRFDAYERGVDMDDAAQSRIVSDGRGKAASAVASYVRDNFLVVGEGAWARYRPALTTAHGRAGEGLQPRLEAVPVLMKGRLPPLNPWRAASAGSAWGGEVEALDALAAAVAAFPARPDCIHDVLRTANWAAVSTRSLVTADYGMYARRSVPAGVMEGLGATLESLAPYEVTAATGGIGAMDARVVLDLAAKAFDLHAQTVMPYDFISGNMGRYRGYVDGYVADALERHAERGVDARAFMGM